MCALQSKHGLRFKRNVRVDLLFARAFIPPRSAPLPLPLVPRPSSHIPQRPRKRRVPSSHHTRTRTLFLSSNMSLSLCVTIRKKGKKGENAETCWCGALLPALVAYLVRMMPSYFCWNHFWASVLVTWWHVPTLLWRFFLRATLLPGLSRTMKKSMPGNATPNSNRKARGKERRSAFVFRGVGARGPVSQACPEAGRTATDGGMVGAKRRARGGR